VIVKYQTGVMPIICDSPTDAISCQTSIGCAGVLSQRLSSWLMNVLAVGHSVFLCFFGVATVIYYVSEHDDASIIG